MCFRPQVALCFLEARCDALWPFAGRARRRAKAADEAATGFSEDVPRTGCRGAALKFEKGVARGPP